MENLESVLSTKPQAKPPSAAPKSIDAGLSTSKVAALANEDQARRDRIEGLTARVAELSEERRRIMDLRNKALLPDLDRPGKAKNKAKADEHQKHIEQLDAEIEAAKGTLDAAKQQDREHRHAERLHDHRARLSKIKHALEDRAKLAADMDKAAQAFANSYKALQRSSEAIATMVIKTDSRDPSTSGASVRRTENAIRERLRDLGMPWAAEQRVHSSIKSPEISEVIRDFNEQVWRAQPEHPDE